MKQTLITTLFCGLLFCLGFSAKAQGTIIYFSGPDSVCAHSTSTHTILYYGDQPDHYSWSVVRGSVALYTPPSSANILWGIPGTGTLTVTAYDTLNHIIADTSIDITILPQPSPGIFTSARLACQPLEEPAEGDELGPFVDTPCLKVCAYSDVTYTATGDPSSTYDWTILGGDIVSATGQTCTVHWLAPGPGKVIVKETSLYGCIGEATRCMDIIEVPLAHVVSLPDTSLRHIYICQGTEVIFFDYSTFDPTSPIVSWRWDFGDNTFSNEKSGPWAPVTHTYNNPGTYYVILTVTNQCGCSTSDTLTIDVDPSPGVDIVCPGVVCDSATYIYHVNASCPGGSWQVEGGTINSQSPLSLTVTWDHVNQTSGYGYIIYDPAGSCPGLCPYPIAKKIPVVKKTADIQGPDYLCLNQQYLYTLPQWPTTAYNWAVNSTDVILQHTDQPNEIVLTPKPTASGTVTLTCRYTNTLLGCTGTATKVISIPGAVTITDTVFKFCQGVETIFHSAGPNAGTGVWTLLKPDQTTVTGGGTSFAVTLDLIGTYLLSLKGDFCPVEPKEIKVLGNPDAPEFITGPGRICRGVPTAYTAGVIDANHVFTWSVTNGTLNIPLGEVTDVTLNPGANYPFTLSVQRVTKEIPHCVSDPTIKTIEAPIVIFFVKGPDTVCPSLYYNYFISSGDFESRYWSIYPQQMGSVDSGQGTANVKVLWNKQPGLANVVCRVTKCGVDYYDTLKVYIRDLHLDLTLSDDTICMHDDVYAQVNVSTTSGVKWDIGERSFKTPPGWNSYNLLWRKAIKDYTTYHVTAVVDSPWGCPTPISAEDSVVVIPAPAASASPLAILQGWCEPVDDTLQVIFDTSGLAPLSITWQKNGLTVGTDTFLHVTDTGIYQLILPGAYGCNTYSHAQVYPTHCDHPSPPCDTCTPPNYPTCTEWGWLEVTFFDTCSGLISFKRHLSNPAKLISGYWGAGNDTVSFLSGTDSTATYQVNRAGARYFYYHCNFYDSWGGTTTGCMYEADTAIIFPMIARLRYKPLCTEYAPGQRWVQLIDESSSITPFIQHYFQYESAPYVFPTIASGPTLTTCNHPDTTSQYITYRIIVLNADSLYCHEDVPAYIPLLPHADFRYRGDTTCEKDAAVYFDNFSGPFVSSLKHDWDFGDQTGNHFPEPYRVYNEPNPFGGPYHVTLTVTDPWGCQDDTTEDVAIITKNLGGEVKISPDFPCEHTTATAMYNKATGTRTPVSYEWHDLTQSYGNTYPANYIDITNSGYYYTYVTDKYRCSETTPGDTVLFTRVAPAYISGSEDQCQDVAFTLSAYAGDMAGLTYQWELNGSPISGATDADLVQQLSIPGTYTYKVTTSVPNPGGGFCTDVSDDFVVTVHATPAPPKVSFTVTDCNDYTIELDVSPTYSGTYNWSNGMEGTPVQVHHGGPYQVTYTDDYGCISREKIQTPRDLRVYLWIFPTGCYSLCVKDPNVLTGPIAKFTQWDYLYNSVSFTGGPGYVYNTSLNMTGPAPGVYNLYLQNAWCSITSGDMNVDTNCTPNGPGSIGGIKPGTTQYVPNLVSSVPELQLVPNPAGNSTQVSYNLAGKEESGYIEVYDVIGRIMFGRKLNTHRGSFDIDLGHFAPGMYHVILRRDGNILLHRNLSVVR